MTVTILEWLIVGLGFVASIYAIVAAVIFSVAPGETEDDHPKRLIFKENR